MIKYLLVMACLLQVTVQAQTIKDNSFPVKGYRVTVQDWGSRSLYIVSDAFFNETKDSIIAQIGEAEFAEMEKHCVVSGWPKGFYLDGVSDEEDKAFHEKLNLLKMYKIASFQHIFKGKLFDRYAVLRIPYSENKAWDDTVEWEGSVYFLLKEGDVSKQ